MCVLQVVAEIQSGEADEKAAAPEALQESQEFILQHTVDSPVANVPAALTFFHLSVPQQVKHHNLPRV
jgi:hypothetical protein